MAQKGYKRDNPEGTGKAPGSTPAVYPPPAGRTASPLGGGKGTKRNDAELNGGVPRRVDNGNGTGPTTHLGDLLAVLGDPSNGTRGKPGGNNPYLKPVRPPAAESGEVG